MSLLPVDNDIVPNMARNERTSNNIGIRLVNKEMTTKQMQTILDKGGTKFKERRETTRGN